MELASRIFPHGVTGEFVSQKNAILQGEIRRIVQTAGVSWKLFAEGDEVPEVTASAFGVAVPMTVADCFNFSVA